MKGLWFSIWAASCISLGLFMAYIDGGHTQGAIASASAMSLMVAGVLASIYGFRVLQRKLSPQRGKTHQPLGQRDAKEEALNAADFERAAWMIGGAGFGVVVGLKLFTELYAIVASSILGCATILLIAMWRRQRLRRPRRKE